VEFAKVFSTSPRALDAYKIFKNSMPQYARSATDVADLAKDLARYDASFANLISTNPDALALWDIARQDAKGAAAFLDDFADDERAALEAMFSNENFKQYVKPWLDKGDDFEEAMGVAVTNEAHPFWQKMAERLGIKPEDFKLDDYEVFDQVQLKTGNKVGPKKEVFKPGDPAPPAGMQVRDEYFIADFVLVKKVRRGTVVTLDFNNAIVVETKLSETTVMTTRQTNGLDAAKAGRSLPCRNDVARTSLLGGTGQIDNNITLVVKDWIKAWSDSANEFGDIKSLMK
jgi:hypothetical protein